MKIEIKKSKKPIEYERAIRFLEQRVDKIHKNKDKELIWILSHPPIYTAGTSHKEDEILDKSIKLSTKKPCLNLSIALLDSAGIVKSFVCFSNKFKEE